MTKTRIPRALKEESEALKGVLDNIRDPARWIDTEDVVNVIRQNPSLRGFAYGYVAEQEFVKWLHKEGIQEHEHYKEPEHDRKKSKSDRTLTYRGNTHTVQVKSMQTNSIREATAKDKLDKKDLGGNPVDITFVATVQNDASDSRDIKLPNGNTVHTTCYAAGEYDVLAVSIQPFVGHWAFAFKPNKQLRRTKDKKYREEDRPYLLATTEIITWPLSGGWTTKLFDLLDVDNPSEIVEIVQAAEIEQDKSLVEHAVVLVEENGDEGNG